MKIVSFTPVKLNNERVPGKNTKRFKDGTPLIQCILKTLMQVSEIDESYVYCSKEEIKDYLLPGIQYLKRDEKYDSQQADVNDMFRTFSLEIPADIYILAHATAPFTGAESISRGIQAVASGKYDSAVAVQKIQDFFWKDGKPMNYDTLKIPRTQDLEPMYEETTGLYIFTKDVIQNRCSRIGNKPYMLEVSPIEATDINNPIDFVIADSIHEYLKAAQKL